MQILYCLNCVCMVVPNLLHKAKSLREAIAECDRLLRAQPKLHDYRCCLLPHKMDSYSGLAQQLYLVRSLSEQGFLTQRAKSLLKGAHEVC